MRAFFNVLAVVLVCFIFASMVVGYTERASLSALAEYYLEEVPRDLGAANVVTGILITYRGLDTLGEVAVLFMVAASVGILLARKDDIAPQPGERAISRRAPSELVVNGAEVVLPIVFLFGAYVILNGHLSAGGGFQGGAVIASGVLLLLLARPSTEVNHGFLSVAESLAGVIYVACGILGLVLADGFLDSRMLPRGELGSLASAGSIPFISVLLGAKVGAELSVIIDRFRS